MVPSATPPVTSPILEALYRGQPDEARRLAESAGAGQLSLHEAAALGEVGRLEQLLAQDSAAANVWSDDGFQPLGLACFFGQGAAAEFLLGRGAELNTPARHPFHVTALHAALASPEPALARTLIAAGADVNARQQGGVTPLHQAAHRGEVELVRLLLAHGADRAAKDDQGRTAADHAREHDQPEVRTLLETPA